MTLQHLRSGTANKRPTPGAMADGQLAVNTEATSPGLFLKDSAGNLVKVGPVHVGATAPNASPATGGSAGNAVGEQWLDTSGSTYVFKIWDGSAWRSEAGEFVNATGDTMTGALVMDNQQQVRFRETTANGTNYIALQAPASVASDKTITLPDVTGTVVTTGDTGTVTSTMLLDGTIVNADVNASAAIAGTKISPDFGSQNVTTTGTSTAASFIPTSSTAPSNGLYLSGTNTVALATASTGRLFVDASGNVGVAYSSPSNFAGGDLGASAPLVVGDGTGSRNLTLFSANNVYGSLAFADSTTGSAKYAGLIQYYHANDTMQFYTGSTQRMVIDSSGRLGLGTSVPGYLFEASRNTTGDVAAFTASTDRLRPLVFSSSDNTASGAVWTRKIDSAFGIHAWSTNSVERMRLTSTGLGIGTTGPLSPLVVSNGSNKNIEFLPGSNCALFAYDRTAGDYLNLDIASKVLTFNTKTGGAESARLTSDGKFLVGTSSSPSAGSGQFARVVAQGNTSSSTGAGILSIARGSTATATNDTIGQLAFTDSIGATFAYIECVTDATPGAGDLPGRLTFSTTADGASSPTERMRIASDGAIYFQTTATPSTSSYGTVITSGNVFLHSRNTTSAVAQFYGSSGEFRVLGTGNVQNTNNSYGAISDARLKENIEAAGSQWDDLKALDVVNFNFIGSDQRQIGLVAQQVEQVSPGLVEDVPDDEAGTTSTKGVKYSVLYMKAVKALQEAMERIEALEARIAAAGI